MGDKNEDKTVILVCGPMRKHLINGHNKKAQHVMAGLGWGVEGMHLSGRVKITPGECILRVTHPNVDCCQNVVSNTAIPSSLIMLDRSE